MMRRCCKRLGCAVVLFAAWFACARAMADTPLAYATIEPQKIVMGQSAIMRITSLGPSMGAFTMPVVQGLDFELLGHANQMEFVNGTSFPTSSVVLRVTAQFAGIYKIPAVTPKSQPLILEVVPAVPQAVVAPPPRAGQPAIPTANLSALNAARAAGLRMTSDGSAFLRLSAPKRDVFVGEIVPVDIELGLRAGFVTSIHGLPTLTGSEFTLNNLSREPEHELRKIDGKTFEVLIWHSVIAAVKPGGYSLSVDTPLTVKIRTQSQQESQLDDLLGDPFLQNRFGAMVKRDITVSSPATNLKVLALPAAGRPADFSGAVGDFKVTSELSSDRASAGEPLMLRMHISGSGNFDRVDTAMFKHLDQWKTYPPTSTFKKSDAVGAKGEKLFEQPVIASQSGTQTLPPLSFNYFDPVARRYATASGSALNVMISAPLANSAPMQTAAAPTSAAVKALLLRPNHADAGVHAQYLTPVYLRTAFLSAASVLAAALALGVLLLGRASVTGLTPAMKRQLAAMDAARRSGNATSFLATAHTTLRAALAERWQLDPALISVSLLREKLGEADSEVLQLFFMAEEALYSGQAPSSLDFSHWTQVVRTVIEGRRA
jgi:hypothetical protein